MNHVRRLFTFVLLLVSASPPLVADPSIAELQLAPEVDVVDLHFDGWLGVLGDQYTVTTPARFGSVDGTRYTPGPNFWSSGGDSFTVRVTAATGAFTDHLVLLTTVQLNEYEMRRTFENNGLATIGDWEPVGAKSMLTHVTPGLGGSQGAMAIQLDGTDTSAALRRNAPDLTEGENSVGALGDMDLPPPFSDGEADFLVSHSPQAVNAGAIRLAARSHAGGTWDLRAVVDDCVGGLPCETPPIPVGPGALSFDLWLGPKVFGHPVNLALSLRLTVVQGHVVTTHWLDDLPSTSFADVDFGVTNPFNFGSTDVLFDNIAVRSGRTEVESRLHRFDDFEDGLDPTEWSLDGPVTLGLDAHRSNSTGVVFDVSAAAASVGGRAQILDTTPSQATAMTQRMIWRLTDLGLADGEHVVLLSGAETDDPDVGRLLSLKLRRHQGAYQLRARAYDDHGVLHKTPWATVPSDAIDLTLVWKAGSGDGLVRLFVDGTWVGEATSIDNDSRRLESVRYGALGVVLSNPINGLASRQVLLDDLIVFQ